MAADPPGAIHPDAPWETGRDPRFARSTLGLCLLWVSASFFAGVAIAGQAFLPRVPGPVTLGILAAGLGIRGVLELRNSRRPPNPDLERSWRGERRAFRSRLLGLRVEQPFTPLFCAIAAFIAGWALRFTWWPAATVALGMVLEAGKRVWLGGVEVQWPAFPLRTGSELTIHVATTPGSGHLESPWIWLGCHETRKSWLRGYETRNVASAVAMRRPVSLAVGDPGPEEFVEFDVSIPAGAPASRLRGPVTVHWVLVVGGRLRGRPFTECVLLPVG